MNEDPTEPESRNATPPAIVLVAHGATTPAAKDAYAHIDRAARRRYTGHEIRWAFTSAAVRARVVDRRSFASGVSESSLDKDAEAANAKALAMQADAAKDGRSKHDAEKTFVIRSRLAHQPDAPHSPTEVAATLRTTGVTEAVFQALTITARLDTASITETAGPMKIAVGGPLLGEASDIAATAAAIAGETKPGAANIIAAHGRRGDNALLNATAEAIFAMAAESERVFFCTLEGRPGAAALKKAKAAAASTGRAHFIPLLLAAGGHVTVDILGDGETSWKSIVSAPRTTASHPVAYNNSIIALFFDRIDRGMTELTETRRRTR